MEEKMEIPWPDPIKKGRAGLLTAYIELNHDNTIAETGQASDADRAQAFLSSGISP